MATGTTSRGAAARARIVGAAATLVHERGVAATSLDDVLAASGAGKSQLYHYFGGGKADLVAAVLDAQAEQVLAHHAELLGAVTDLAGLRRWADVVVGHQELTHGRGGCPVGSLAAELADASDTYRLRLAAAFARWEALLTAAVARAVPADGLAPGTDAADGAAVLLAALQGGLLLTQTTHDVRHLRLALHRAIDGLTPAS